MTKTHAARLVRHWYETPAFKRLKREQIAKQHGLCAFCGLVMFGPPDAPTYPVLDHKTPHKGNRTLFYDPDNVQALCKHCHDSAKAREENAGYALNADADGWPIDPLHPANRKD